MQASGSGPVSFMTSATTAITDRHVEKAQRFVDRHAPVNAAELAASAHTLLPHQRARFRLHGVDHAGFLAGVEQIPAVGRGCQDGRCAEVVVGTVRFRTVGVEPAGAAGRVPGVSLGELVMPADAAVRQIQGKDRIRGIRGGIAVVFSGGEVEETAFPVDGGRLPDGGAGRAFRFEKEPSGVGHLSFFLNGIAAPDFLAAGCIERGHRASEGAAAVHGRRCCDHLVG